MNRYIVYKWKLITARKKYTVVVTDIFRMSGYFPNTPATLGMSVHIWHLHITGIA